MSEQPRKSAGPDVTAIGNDHEPLVIVYDRRATAESAAALQAEIDRLLEKR